jgi:Ni/Fe-hydrogenase 1 B-type cytochrome subunit
MRTERVYVWEVPVRLTHWVNVAAILVLSASGFYIGHPVLGGTTFLMAWVRGTHRITAWVFIASLALRVYWGFMGNRWASWRVLFPWATAEGRREVWRTLLYYLFVRRQPPSDLGHNPLAAATYSLVVLLILVEVATGLALQSLGTQGWRTLLVGWLFAWVSPQGIRLTHHLIMWLLLGFAVHHVYSAILVDAEERNGTLTSIFSGYKWARRRA